MSLTAKIALTIFCVFAAALAMTTALNYLRFEQTLRSVLTQRMNVVTNEASRDLQAGIDLGLRLESMENLREILQRRHDMSDEIAAISVLDCQGGEIAGFTGKNNDLALPEIERGAREEVGNIVFAGGFAALGKELRDSLGQCAGHLVVIADLGPLNRRLGNAYLEMWKAAGYGMIGVVPIFALLVVLMRRRHRVFDELNADVKRAVNGQVAAVAVHDGDLLTRSEMEMVARYRDIRDRLSEPDFRDDDSNTDAGKAG